MTRTPSLQGRVIGGAVLWSVGLLLVASGILVAVIESDPAVASSVHRALGHTPAVAALALVLLSAGAWQVRRGLSSLGRLRTRLAAVHRGETARVDGEYPAEVQPLVDDLNDLLDARERHVQRAQAKAGDLAHGLKTPLAVLAHESHGAARAGYHELAAALDQQIDRMRRQIDYHLAHARAAASGANAVSARSAVDAAASALAEVLGRIHPERDVSIDVQTPAGHAVRCHRQDLDEMLGNLMDNACKWARSRVVVSSADAGHTIIVNVEDDGPGLDPAMEAQVLRRGVRLDETVPGSGLGLAIAGDLAELYGGALSLERSPRGGVAARLELPNANAQPPSG